MYTQQLRLFYHYVHYDQYACNSCGALCEVDHDPEYGRKIKKEPHSKSCLIGQLLNYYETDIAK